MTAPVPERVAFAVEAMDPQPGGRVLEIGCGDGTAIAPVHDRIRPGGTYLAVDRSATQIDRARRRNRTLLGSGSVELRLAEFPDLGAPAGPFDLIFAIGVPAFRSGDPAVPAAAATRLRAGGELWVFDEPPPGVTTGPLSMRISTAVAMAGLAVVDIVERGRVVGVLATPIR